MDPHRQPKDRDRSALVDRINKAATEGRIGAADRDIRLGNVRSAQSMSELALIARDLDLLDQTLAAGAAPAVTFGSPQVDGPEAATAPAGSGSTAWEASTGAGAVETVQAGAKRVAVTVVLVLVLAVVGGAVFAVVAFSGGGGPSTSGELFDPVPVESADPADSEPPGGPGEDPIEDPEVDPQVDPDEPAEPYALTAPGIRAFLAAYRQKFGTTRVVGMTLYDDYAIVRVPVPGKQRNSGWLYRPGQGWSDFGGVTANFPGSGLVETARLDVAALIRNIARARRTLNVEEISTTYVNVDYRPDFDDAPNVNIYVSNEFHESGYLATTLDGSVERAYAFGG